MTPTINSKLPHVGTTIFTEMSALAREHNAVNLSQGFPDFECSNQLKDAIIKSVKHNQNQYGPMQGILPLRESIAEKTEKFYGKTYNPESEITVVPGATIGIFTAITCCIRSGDEVIIIEPAYDCYVPAVELCGGKCVYSSLMYPNFGINWEEIKSLINGKTRLIIINSPQNPGTSVLKTADLEMLNELTKNTQILILSDEVYEHIIFDGQKHLSLAGHSELAERSFIVSSFGKTFHVTGWKTGYVLAPASMTKEFRKVYQYNAFCSFTPAQWAFYEMLQDENNFLNVSDFYQGKRDYFSQLIESSRFKIIPSAGSYFQLLEFSNISDENDLEFVKRLTREYKVATIPLSSFYHNKTDHKLIRICFAKNDETLEKAAAILNAVK